MNQELIDLLRGELPEAEAAALRARIEQDADLRAEYRELESLFGFFHTDELSAPASMRATVLAAARNAHAAPARRGWLDEIRERVDSLRGLVAYRFRESMAFRAASFAVLAHLLFLGVMYALWTADEPSHGGGRVHWTTAEVDVVVPDQRFARRLAHRRLPKGPRLQAYGVEGQAEAIRASLAALPARQNDDGAFGTVDETAYAALALLAEGHCSVQNNRPGLSLHRALVHLQANWQRAENPGLLLAALVEDYVLSFEHWTEFDRLDRVQIIAKLMDRAADSKDGFEGLVLAKLAGFELPSRADLGESGELILAGRHHEGMLSMAPTRQRVTFVLARGPDSLDRDRVAAWARPLFADALKRLDRDGWSAASLLALQAVYRL
ncbi:MAG: hypothetical protein V3T86_12025 [Planctomycetota bacterium]